MTQGNLKIHQIQHKDSLIKFVKIEPSDNCTLDKDISNLEPVPCSVYHFCPEKEHYVVQNDVPAFEWTAESALPSDWIESNKELVKMFLLKQKDAELMDSISDNLTKSWEEHELNSQEPWKFLEFALGHSNVPFDVSIAHNNRPLVYFAVSKEVASALGKAQVNKLFELAQERVQNIINNDLYEIFVDGESTGKFVPCSDSSMQMVESEKIGDYGNGVNVYDHALLPDHERIMAIVSDLFAERHRESGAVR